MTIWAPEVQIFLDIWADGELHDDIGTALSCTEADALAGLFRFLGDEDAAESLLAAHAAGDDEGDEHFIGEDA